MLDSANGVSLHSLPAIASRNIAAKSGVRIAKPVLTWFARNRSDKITGSIARRAIGKDAGSMQRSCENAVLKLGELVSKANSGSV